MESHDKEFAGGLRPKAMDDPNRFGDLTGPPFIEEPVKIAWTVLLQENDNKVYGKWLVAQAVDQMDALSQLWESAGFKLSSRAQDMVDLTIRIIPNSQYSGIVS